MNNKMLSGSRLEFSWAATLVMAAALSSNSGAAQVTGETAAPPRDPYPSTYQPPLAQPLAIVHAKILTAAGSRIDDGTVIVADTKIVAVGRDIAIPPQARIVEAQDRWVTPGIVDPHSHIGVGASPGIAGDNPNEPGDNNAGLWIEHSIWPQDPMFERARRAGVTTIQILPGSGSLFAGRTVVLKNIAATTAQAMKFPGAPYGLKMACGENVTSSIGNGRPGRTRAGAMLGYRNAFIAASDYRKRADDYASRRASGQPAEPPRPDPTQETLAGALRGDILIHIHCYRANDMAQMIDLSHEFGFRIAAFHHANEAFKIAPLLAKEHIAVATWAGDWSGYKMEAYDSIMENAAFVDRAGGVAMMHSDDVRLMQHLNHEAARVMTAAQEAGLAVTPEDAIRWLTINPATTLGIGDLTGSLEPGKMADVVLWNADPFSTYSMPQLVLIDGAVVYDSAAPSQEPQSDFELGITRRKPSLQPANQSAEK